MVEQRELTLSEKDKEYLLKIKQEGKEMYEKYKHGNAGAIMRAYRFFGRYELACWLLGDDGEIAYATQDESKS